MTNGETSPPDDSLSKSLAHPAGPHENPLYLNEKVREWHESLLRSTVDVALIFLTPDARVADWLGAAERMFGYTRREALGMPFAAFFTEEDKALGLHAQELALACANGRSEDDRWHARQDAGRFWANGVLSAIRGDDGQVIALCKMVRDRTDIRTQVVALENQLAARIADIERRDRLTTSVAHELLNPMMPIMSAVAVLQSGASEALRSRACEIIERQVGLLKNLIDDLNAGARAVSAQALIEPVRVSANQALRESADALRDTVQAHGLKLTVVLPEETIWIDADPRRLQQMLLNLVGNSIKYTPAGGRVTLSVTVEGEMAVIRVEDNGRGIAPEIIPRIFDLFTREERGARIPGLGVGLSVVQDLARRHGGIAEARSPGIGLGSIFGLRLPLFRQPPGEEAAP